MESHTYLDESGSTRRLRFISCMRPVPTPIYRRLGLVRILNRALILVKKKLKKKIREMFSHGVITQANLARTVSLWVVLILKSPF